MQYDLIDHEFDAPIEPSPGRLAILRELERRVLWLSSWTIHHANHVRPNPDGLKVGGHQASSASLATLMTALYFSVLRPEDRVAVKPHASPVFHAIQYLFGNQSRSKLEQFRALGGAQAYPSRTKDVDDVDFSTGSVGLGVAMTSFAALVQDYLAARPWHRAPTPRGRMVALVGDAELDEGNVYEALLEGWKHDVRNVWWVVDYNRQSLDSVITDRLFGRFSRLFSSMGWRVVNLKYGARLQAAFERPGGEALRQWIDACPNSLYSALVFKGAQAWRERLLDDVGHRPGVRALVGEYSDDALCALMTNLGGHDMQSVLDAFESVEDDQPTCFIAYTIKGYGLPFAGHKDNHSGLMSVEQIEELRESLGVVSGGEWEPFSGLSIPQTTIRRFLADAPLGRASVRRHHADKIGAVQSAHEGRNDAPQSGSGSGSGCAARAIEVPRGDRLSTQDAFGRILDAIAREDGAIAERLVTTSPDVTVSTSLGGWVNRRGVFTRDPQDDLFSGESIGSFQRWRAGPQGQHLELGIAENNLFVMLAALGLSHSLFGTRLLPIGTVYDPFIERGLDALNYACYQDARFILVATPSGITLAPEGGAHQSIATPLIGLAQPGLEAFEPAYADELAGLLEFAFDYLQRDGALDASVDPLGDRCGGSVYLRLSTRKIDQLPRDSDRIWSAQVIEGAYWLEPPAADASVAIAYMGAVAPEARAAHEALRHTHPGAGLLAITSADRLHRGWQAAKRLRRQGVAASCPVEERLADLPSAASLVTVHDGHPATLSWLGAVRGHAIECLGVEHFGQSGSIEDLYRTYGIDTAAVVEACLATTARS